jgi:hypothetical protein
MADFLKTVQERVVIYDGAMGTNIHKRNPPILFVTSTPIFSGPVAMW